MQTAREINIARGRAGTAVWQPDYFDRVIRDTGELERIRKYIRDNPLNWDGMSVW